MLTFKQLKLKCRAGAVALAALLATLGACAGPALAECSTLDQIEGGLNSKYAEHPVFADYDTKRRVVMHLFLSKSGTWTLVQVNAEGLVCSTAAEGVAGHSIVPALEGVPS